MHRRPCAGRPRPALPLASLFASVTLLALLAAPALASEGEAGSGSASSTQPPSDRTFLDEVTVTATQSESTLRETPGEVSVITDDEIEDRLIENAADLVQFEPGVYVENDVARLGLNGFNIRGIGGNRVLTQVDGVRRAEQFDFGPFSVHQQSIDLDALKSAEIVRSAGSALYGSDALGGVVSLLTKDPADYLGGDANHLGAKLTFDGRSDDTSLALSAASGWESVQASIFLSAHEGGETDNQGEIGGDGPDRELPNPQDREGFDLLGKLVWDVARGNSLRVSAEANDGEVITDAFSSRGTVVTGPVVSEVLSAEAEDGRERSRLGVDQTLVARGLDLLRWRIYGQDVETTQVVDENRVTSGFGPPTRVLRTGDLRFEQSTVGGRAQAQQEWRLGSEGSLLLTGGVDAVRDEFDMVRDRLEIDSDTGEVVPQSLPYPSKYFPTSETTELGAYAQAELRWSRFTLIPGVRWDRFELDPDENDPVYLGSGGLPPAGFEDDALSPKLGLVARINDHLDFTAQYAAGFRAPPYSAVNTGFTNLAGGYQTLPNPALEPETSDNFELGLRGSFGRTSWSVNGFQNRYDDFIELQSTGFDPFLGVIEFQNVNVAEVEIEGVELRAESRLSDNFLLRVAYADIEGNDVTGEEDVPLASVPPDEGVLGLRWFADSGRWGLDGSLRVAASRSASETSGDQFLPDGYEVLDLVGFVDLSRGLTLRVGVMNLTDETYSEWWNVRGRPADDPRIGLYTSPGRNVVASLGWSW